MTTAAKVKSMSVAMPAPVVGAPATSPIANPVAVQGQKKKKSAATAAPPPVVPEVVKPTPVAIVIEPALAVPKPAAAIVQKPDVLPVAKKEASGTQSTSVDLKGKGPAICTSPSAPFGQSLLPELPQVDHDGIDEAELQLLDGGLIAETESSDSHERKTAPLFTRDAKSAAGFSETNSQYGVLGKLIAIRDQHKVERPVDPRVYVNTNAPFSAIVCGVQGAGKSHTVSVLLENMLIPGCPEIGPLEKPLAGLVLHFGPGGRASLPCEAAWLGKAKFRGLHVPPVHVYVSKSALGTMKQVYEPLGESVIVEPLLFTEDELDAEAFRSMMAVGPSTSIPLYMSVVLSLLDELGEHYTYHRFLESLEEKKKTFSSVQKAHLEQRMGLLKRFTSTATQERARFASGQITIVDLSDPFIDPKSACGLFEIVIRLFVRAGVNTGKVLLVDEAHKYLSASARLTEALLSLSRQIRHNGMRVIISSQEPTVVPPVLLDLCSMAILHRFSSGSWWSHIANHFSADLFTESAFDEVVKLKTGEAIVLAPSSLTMLRPPGSDNVELGQLGRSYMLVKTRMRVTQDGGASIMVV